MALLTWYADVPTPQAILLRRLMEHSSGASGKGLAAGMVTCTITSSTDVECSEAACVSDAAGLLKC